MSFLSVLHAIGKGALKTVQVVGQVQATGGAQLIESAFLPPTVVKLINAGVASVGGASDIARQAVHTTELTGPQKMAIAMAAFNQAYVDYAKEAGLPAEPDKAQAILQGCYDLLTKIQISAPEPAGTLPGGVPATPSSSS